MIIDFLLEPTAILPFKSPIQLTSGYKYMRATKKQRITWKMRKLHSQWKKLIREGKLTKELEEEIWERMEDLKSEWED